MLHNHPHGPTKAVCYARFSPRPGAEDCDSIARQMERVHAYAAAHGWQVILSCFDRAQSGADDDRAGLQLALSTAIAGKLPLIVYKLDRLARNTRDAIDISDRLAKGKADLVMIAEHIDTTTPVGRCTFTIFAALAQLQREQAAERTSSAMLSHLHVKHRKMGSQAPYGWRATGRLDAEGFELLEEDGQEQAAKRKIAELHRAGLGYEEIARQLAIEGFPPRGEKWHRSTVMRILKDT